MAANVILVYDGERTTVPEVMGTPAEGQLASTPMDRLHELCGRVSYDSLGRGRASEAFHENLRVKGHRAVYRHGTLNFGVDLAMAQQPPEHLWALADRPGVYLTGLDGFYLRFTCNAQAALEWHRRRPLNPAAHETSRHLGHLVQWAFLQAAPLSIGFVKTEPRKAAHDACPNFKVHFPETDREVYASVFLSDISRVAADELLRHTFECAPSMESTRYCDYSRRPWVAHPLFHRPGKDYDWCRDVFRKIELHCRAAYNGLFGTLTALCPEAGVKEVRAAARGVIALSAGTRLIFTASLSAWHSIFKLRISDQADSEIRGVCEQIKAVLAARWPNHFAPED